MKNHIIIICSVRRLFCVLSLLFVSAGFAFSQTPLPKGAKLQTIEHKSTDYIAIGYIHKNQFVEGQKITFYSKDTRDTIISGRYTKIGINAYIDGVWRKNTDKGMTRTKGVFRVANYNGIGLSIKPKEWKPLTIEATEIYRYQGFRNKYPAVLEKQRKDGTYLLTVRYTDRKEANDVIKKELIVSKDFIEKYGFFAIDEFIFYTTDIKNYHNNGDIFIGTVENTKTDDNLISSKYKEGKITYTAGNVDEEELIKLPDNNYLYREVRSNRMKDNNIAEIEMTVNKLLVEKYGYWAIREYGINTSGRKIIFKNGDIFNGKIENDTINNTFQYTEGEYKYATGEVFQGNLSGQWFCGVPISGEMKFTDGSIVKNNWLKKYELTQAEYDEVLKENSPTKKRILANKLSLERQYQDAINEAEIAMNYGDYKTANNWYLQAKNIMPEKSSYIDSQIEKITKLQAQEEKRLAEQKKKQAYIAKYGEYYGTLINKGELDVGMSQAMVSEVWNKDFFVISKSVRSGKSIEIWEFSKDKMQMAILNEGAKNKDSGGGEAALAAIFLMGLSEQLGGPKAPSMLIFTNGKLTDVYR